MAANPNFYSEDERNIARVAWLASEIVTAKTCAKIAVDEMTRVITSNVGCADYKFNCAEFNGLAFNRAIKEKFGLEI